MGGLLLCTLVCQAIVPQAQPHHQSGEFYIGRFGDFTIGRDSGAPSRCAAPLLSVRCTSQVRCTSALGAVHLPGALHLCSRCGAPSRCAAPLLSVRCTSQVRCTSVRHRAPAHELLFRRGLLTTRCGAPSRCAAPRCVTGRQPTSSRSGVVSGPRRRAGQETGPQRGISSARRSCRLQGRTCHDERACQVERTCPKRGLGV